MCMYPYYRHNLDELSDIAYKLVFKVRWPWPDYKIKYKTVAMAANFDTILEAEGPLSFDRGLAGGAIHCFRTLEDAHDSGYCFDAILKVKGTNTIAYNNTEIAFRKIEVLEEVFCFPYV